MKKTRWRFALCAGLLALALGVTALAIDTTPKGTVTANADQTYTATYSGTDLVAGNQYVLMAVKGTTQAASGSDIAVSNIMYAKQAQATSATAIAFDAFIPKENTTCRVYLSGVFTTGSTDNIDELRYLGSFVVATAPSGGSSGGGSVTSYTLIFETNGGSTIDKVSKSSGTAVDLSTYKPTRDGYTFVGWYSDKDLTKAVTSVKLSADTTVYAKWTAMLPTTTKMPFTDVAENSWYSNAVSYAYSKGLFAGTTKTLFSPDLDMSRGMLVTVLYRLDGKPAVTAPTAFADVDSSAYYADPVSWAASNGIVKGYANTKFGPNDPITREEMAVILYRYATYRNYDTTQGGMAIREFKDYESISDYARTAMEWAVNAGLISGMGDNTLAPQGNAIRAQVATILMRFEQNLVK